MTPIRHPAIIPSMLALSLYIGWQPASAQSNLHVVKSGDTPCEIAESYQVPCADLISANSLGSNPVIYPGQTLVIPGAAVSVEPSQAAQNNASDVGSSTDSSGGGSAQTSGSSPKTDLLEVYVLARAQDPVFAAETYRYQAAREVVPQSKAALRPQLSASGTFTQATSDRIDASQAGVSLSQSLYNTSQAGVSLSQSLYNKSNRISVTQANKRVDQAELVFQTASENLVSRTVRAYFTVLAAQDNLELSRRNRKALNRQLELAQERLDVGLGTKTELFDARARYEKAVADSIESEKLLDDANQALFLLVGEDVGDIVPLPDSVSLGPPQPDDSEQWIERALRDNPTLKAKDLGVDLSNLEIDRQKAQRLPTVGLQLSGNYSDTGATGSDTYGRLLLSVNVPFYQGGLIDARTREAAENLNASRSDYQASARQIRRDTRQTFLGIKSRLRRLEALEAAVQAGENALVAKEEGFSAGLTTNIAVLDAQRDLFLAQRDYLKERYDYILQMLELERLSGDLNEQDVRRVNALLLSGN